MKILKVFLVLLCVSVCLTGVANALGDWTLIENRDGIRSYKKAYAGSDVCEYKSVGFVNAPIEVILAVIRDVSAYPEWSPLSSKTELLEDIDRNNKVFYSVTPSPFPLKDRDMVLKHTLDFDYKNGTAQIYFWTPETPQVPSSGGCTRMTDYSGKYRLMFWGSDWTWVVYEQKIGREGAGLQNCPRSNLIGLREMVKKQRYIDKGRDSVEHILIGRMIDSPEDIRRVLINRMSSYVVDRALLKLVFDEKRLAEYVFAEKASFNSILAAIKGALLLILTSPPVGDHIKDKPMQDFFVMRNLAEEVWMINPVFRDKRLVEPLLNNQNGIFEKILQSEYTLRVFLEDASLIRAIATSPEAQQKIVNDVRLKEKILSGLSSFSGPQAVEPLVKESIQP